MRGLYTLSAAILFICMLMLPLTNKTSKAGQKPPEVTEELRIKTADGVKNMSADEYILGVVSAEMPALYKEEALKAQAVAAYTYAVKKCADNKNAEYDLTTDPALDQGYIDEKERKEKWGANCEKYEARIKSAIAAVKGKTVTYNGEPIMAVYHAVSSGKTEKAETVWGTDYPYLQTVESVGDMLCETYLSEVVFSVHSLCELLNINFSGTAAEFLGETDKTEAGTVKTVILGGQTFSGNDIRSALSLRSANFEATLQGESLKFTVRGYGHGVGMSQYGANTMASEGADYKKILTYYYTGCAVS